MPLSRIAVDRARKLPGNRVALGGQLVMLGRCLLFLKDWPAAEVACREALAIRETADPDAWNTFNARSMLGAAMLGQGRTAEAEPLLRSGYDGMAKRVDKIPPTGKPRFIEALDRLISLGEATGRADEVVAWKADRAKLAPEAPKPEPDKK